MSFAIEETGLTIFILFPCLRQPYLRVSSVFPSGSLSLFWVTTVYPRTAAQDEPCHTRCNTTRIESFQTAILLKRSCFFFLRALLVGYFCLATAKKYIARLPIFEPLSAIMCVNTCHGLEKSCKASKHFQCVS